VTNGRKGIPLWRDMSAGKESVEGRGRVLEKRVAFTRCGWNNLRGIRAKLLVRDLKKAGQLSLYYLAQFGTKKHGAKRWVCGSVI